MAMKCDINQSCKVKPIKDFLKKYPYEFMQYIGIAVDEPERLKRLDTTYQKSLLQKYRYTEQMAFDLCDKYGLLSPIYQFAKRGGCWFCPNAREKQLRNIRTNHRDLWDKLLELENQPNLIGNMWNTLTKTRLHDWEETFCCEEAQISVFDYLRKGE